MTIVNKETFISLMQNYPIVVLQKRFRRLDNSA